jgi:hypothetical protein
MSNYSGSTPFNLNRKLGYINRTTPQKTNIEIKNIVNNLDSSLPQIEYHMYNLKEISNQFAKPQTNTQSNIHQYLNTTQQLNVVSLSPIQTPNYRTPAYSPLRTKYIQNSKYEVTGQENEEQQVTASMKRVAFLERTLEHKENIINQYSDFIKKTLSKYESLIDENIKLKQQYQMINENVNNNEGNNLYENDNKQETGINMNSNNVHEQNKYDEFSEQTSNNYKNAAFDIEQQKALMNMNDNITTLIKNNKEREKYNDVKINELKLRLMNLEKEINYKGDYNNSIGNINTSNSNLIEGKGYNNELMY